MRLLLDECVPRPLERELAGHDVQHVVDMGWSSKRNGELLKLMVLERFEAMLTVDRNIEFQQNVRASGIGVVVAVARTNRLKELRPLVHQLLEALARISRGELILTGPRAERLRARDAGGLFWAAGESGDSAGSLFEAPIGGAANRTQSVVSREGRGPSWRRRFAVTHSAD